jgi:hypothetical protein
MRDGRGTGTHAWPLIFSEMSAISIIGALAACL